MASILGPNSKKVLKKVFHSHGWNVKNALSRKSKKFKQFLKNWRVPWCLMGVIRVLGYHGYVYSSFKCFNMCRLRDLTVWVSVKFIMMTRNFLQRGSLWDKIKENSPYSIEIINEMQTPTLFIHDRIVFFWNAIFFDFRLWIVCGVKQSHRQLKVIAYICAHICQWQME